MNTKVNMSRELQKKCHIAIHSATVAAATAGAIPLPLADAIPISAAQVGMVIALGNIFGICLSQSAARAAAEVALSKKVGHTVFKNLVKALPGPGQLVGSLTGAITAGVATETIGWIVADRFYQMSSID